MLTRDDAMLTVVAIFELVMALGIAEVWTADNSRSDGSQQRALPRARGGIKESAVMAAAWSSRVRSRSSRLPVGRISAVTGRIPLLVRAHRRRQRHEHSVLTDPVYEAGWLQDHP